MPDPAPNPDQPPAGDKRRPWDQRPGESPAAYGRFLLYRALGPSRSVRAAYHLSTGAGKDEKKRPSSQWERDARAFDWQSRAEAFDLHYLRTAGCLAIARFVALIGDMAVRTLEKLNAEGLKPQNWSDVIATVQALGQHIPPATILRVAESQNQE